MRACGRGASALGVALGYEDFLDTLLIAAEDKNMMEPIRNCGSMPLAPISA